MKELILITCTLVLMPLVHGQNCQWLSNLPFIDIDSNVYYTNGANMIELDSQYPKAILSLPDTGVFENNGGFINAWHVFEKKLGDYLFDNGFAWKMDTWCVHKIYFSKEGIIQNILVKFKTNEITSAEFDQYMRLLIKFTGQYKFLISPDSPYSHCGYVTYVKKKN